jgi:hypothetical protein
VSFAIIEPETEVSCAVVFESSRERITSMVTIAEAEQVVLGDGKQTLYLKVALPLKLFAGV